MKATNAQIIFVIFSFSFVSVAYGQYNWKMTKDKEGITVYQRPVNNSAYKSIKVECTLEGNYNKLFAIVADVNHYKDWVYNNKTASFLKTISPSEFYYYSETFLPWPMNNRDAVMHTTITRDSLNRFLKITSVNDVGLVAEKPGKVRVRHSNINWYVTMPSAQSIHIVYTFEADPGGSIPAWIVNSFADKGPFESFKKLGDLLRQ
jgi:START domain-containing protein